MTRSIKLNRLAAAVSILLPFWGAACALYLPATKTVTKECILPTEQSGTLSGRWPTTPIPVAFHTGDWDASETGDVAAAASTWNQFYTASKNISVLDLGDGANRTSANSDPTLSGSLCALGIVPGNQFTGNVVLYKFSTWPAAYPSSAIALTSFCVIPAKPLQRIYMAVMEVNYQNFFVSGQKLPDLQSILLHEFGHLLGLNHSCEGTDKPGTPNCNNSNLNPDFALASMFPVFSFQQNGIGETRRLLGTNDEGRANCLYDGATPSSN